MEQHILKEFNGGDLNEKQMTEEQEYQIKTKKIIVLHL